MRDPFSLTSPRTVDGSAWGMAFLATAAVPIRMKRDPTRASWAAAARSAPQIERIENRANGAFLTADAISTGTLSGN
jgi:hypothetical protein